MLEQFTEDAELAFEGVPVGPFRGKPAIAQAYADQPPDDEIVILRTRESGEDFVVADYAWRAEPAARAGIDDPAPARRRDRPATRHVRLAQANDEPAVHVVAEHLLGPLVRVRVDGKPAMRHLQPSVGPPDHAEDGRECRRSASGRPSGS